MTTKVLLSIKQAQIISKHPIYTQYIKRESDEYILDVDTPLLNDKEFQDYFVQNVSSVLGDTPCISILATDMYVSEIIGVAGDNIKKLTHDTNSVIRISPREEGKKWRIVRISSHNRRNKMSCIWDALEKILYIIKKKYEGLKIEDDDYCDLVIYDDYGKIGEQLEGQSPPTIENDCAQFPDIASLLKSTG